MILIFIPLLFIWSHSWKSEFIVMHWRYKFWWRNLFYQILPVAVGTFEKYITRKFQSCPAAQFQCHKRSYPRYMFKVRPECTVSDIFQKELIIKHIWSCYIILPDGLKCRAAKRNRSAGRSTCSITSPINTTSKVSPRYSSDVASAYRILYP